MSAGTFAALVVAVLAGWLLLGLAVAGLIGAAANLMGDDGRPGSGNDPAPFGAPCAARCCAYQIWETEHYIADCGANGISAGMMMSEFRGQLCAMHCGTGAADPRCAGQIGARPGRGARSG